MTYFELLRGRKSWYESLTESFGRSLTNRQVVRLCFNGTWLHTYGVQPRQIFSSVTTGKSANTRSKRSSSMYFLITPVSVNTVEISFSGVSLGNLSLPAGKIHSFWWGIRCFGQKAPIPASRGQKIGITKPGNVQNLGSGFLIVCLHRSSFTVQNSADCCPIFQH